METITKKAQHTPEYGIEEITWKDGINLGLRYAVRTVDPLSGVINGGSSTLAYCCTKQQAERILLAVNAHDALVEAVKEAMKALQYWGNKAATYEAANDPIRLNAHLKLNEALAQAEVN